jgi:hypothetical protein
MLDYYDDFKEISKSVCAVDKTKLRFYSYMEILLFNIFSLIILVIISSPINELRHMATPSGLINYYNVFVTFLG